MSPTEPAEERDPGAVTSSIEGMQAVLGDDARARLDFLTVLRVHGSDALAWLQGQLTADIDEVDASTSRIAAWCSPRGRVLATFRVLPDPAGGYRIVCERWFTGALLARLRMFILRSDVHVDDAGEELAVAGVAGTGGLPAGLAAWARAAEVDDITGIGDMTFTRVPGHHRRFMVTGPCAQVCSLASSPSAEGVPTVDPGAWRLADICAGVPRITAQSSDTFLPQMLNLDRLGAVSFEKGCYVGQEIVARAQHLGRVKRRAHVARSASVIAAGDAIVDASAGGAPKVGDVVCSEPHPDGGSAALIVLNLASEHSPALRADRFDGPTVRILLPDAAGSSA